MTKVIAYTALLYGKDYLASAIRSVIDAVDEYHVIYDATEHGSHGHQTDRTCPDKREDLIAIAWEAAKGKMHWNQGYFAHEGEQRMAIHRYAPDADLILALDADEIWPDGMAEHAIKRGFQYNVRTWRTPMVHFWRSFYRCVLHDPAFPTRIIRPSIPEGEQVFYLDQHRTPEEVSAGLPIAKQIAHMGYAQRSEIVEFKQHTHGHRGEWRKDCDWFQDRFMANAQFDCHPVGSEYWNPEPVDPWDYLPEWMKDHPYANLDIIP